MRMGVHLGEVRALFGVIIADISDSDVILFAAGILIVVLLLFAAFCVAWRVSRWRSCPSPYSALPLRRFSSLSYYNIERVLRYLYNLREYENRIFDIRRASFCRETGRIFQDSINWLDVISVDWNFLQKRRPGKYVSWGSLTIEQQNEVRSRHDSLDGFQTEYSSKNPSPRAVEPRYAFRKPGPLYVDFNTFILIGWKEVAGTELEVLIIQRPNPPPRTKFT